MREDTKDLLIFFLVGVLIGIAVTVVGGIQIYRIVKSDRNSGTTQTQTGSTTPARATPNRKDFLLSFEQKDDIKMFETAGATGMSVVQNHATDGKNALMVTVAPGAGYPGVQWEVYGRNAQNWKGAQDFYFDIYNNSEDYVQMEVKFKSGKQYPKKSFSWPVELEPLKMNQVRIPLSTVGNICDLTQMSYMKMFVKDPSRQIVLYIDHIGTQ